MPLVQPDFRYIEIKSGSVPDGISSDLLKSEDFNYAKSVYNNKYKKEILEAFLLTGEPIEHIASILGTPENVIQIYKTIFFETDVFKDKLDIEEYIETYPNEHGKNLKLCAVTLGIKYLRFRYGYEDNDLDISGILESIVESANILASAARINPLNSAVSREARQWVTTTIKAIEALSKIKLKSNAEDDDRWRLVLEELEQSEHSESQKIGPDDIVH